jgi:hypothetical protein
MASLLAPYRNAQALAPSRDNWTTKSWISYLLCYIRGPEGLLIGLAQELS